jgi:hypothetical protein
MGYKKNNLSYIFSVYLYLADIHNLQYFALGAMKAASPKRKTIEYGYVYSAVTYMQRNSENLLSPLQ